MEWFNLIINQRRNQFSLLCKIALQTISESEHRVLSFNPRRSRRRSCFVGEFRKKIKLSYVNTNFLLMLLKDAVMVLWGNREKPRAVKGYLFPSAMGPEPELCSVEYLTDWYVPMISQKGHLTLILLLVKGLHQMTTHEDMGPDFVMSET